MCVDDQQGKPAKVSVLGLRSECSEKVLGWQGVESVARPEDKRIRGGRRRPCFRGHVCVRAGEQASRQAQVDCIVRLAAPPVHNSPV